MKLTEHQARALLEGRETVHLECKSAKGGLPGSVWEAYSAFSNTDGGVILLGVSERAERFFASGVDDVDALQKDFWATVKGRSKVSHCTLQDRDVYPVQIGDKKIMAVVVPRTPRHIRPHLMRPRLRELSTARATELTFVLSEVTTRENGETIAKTGETTKENAATVTDNVVEKDASTRQRMLELLREDPGMIAGEVARRVGISVDGVWHHIRELRKEGVVVRKGSTEAGRWVVRSCKKRMKRKDKTLKI